MGERIRNIEAPEGDGNTYATLTFNSHSFIRNIEAPEGDGNMLENITKAYGLEY